MSQYHDMILGLCDVGAEAIGNAFAVAVGHDGVGPAFGPMGDIPGVGVRAIGSGATTPEKWLAFTLCKPGVVSDVAEYNTAGPYPTLNAKGLADEQVAEAKAVMLAQTYPRATHEFALTEILDALGYELVPTA